MKQILLFLFVLTTFGANAQVFSKVFYRDKKLVPREHQVDFKHLELTIEFEPTKGKVIGKVVHTFAPLREKVDSLVVDAIDMNFSIVLVDGKIAKHTNTGSQLIVHLDKSLSWDSEHKLELGYDCTPEKGLYFVGWDDPKNISRKQIWSQGQGIDNRRWIPMYDEMNDKVTTDIHVKMDGKYQVLSNGDLIEHKGGKGDHFWHYRMTKPHAPYLIMLGIGDYRIQHLKSSSGVPMNLYYYPDWADRFDATYRHSKMIFDYLEKEIGVPYAWNTYAQIPVQDFMFGAMENTTATIFGDFYHVDERQYLKKNYVSVNAHELAHQWFGDLITARSSAHHWLQESFATYYANLIEREVFGQDHYEMKLRMASSSAIAASRKNFKQIAHSAAGSSRHYPKGAAVLHMLRYVVGDEAYRRSIIHYLKKHQFENVDTEDLLIAFHETLGVSLDWFWNQWIHQGGEPFYEVEYHTARVEGKAMASFVVHQSQYETLVIPVFDMPINFRVHMKDGTIIDKKVRVNQRDQFVQFEIPNMAVDFVLFDNGYNIIKKCSFPKQKAMLLSQLAKAEQMTDRYDALVGLREVPFIEKEKALRESFKKESFHFIRKEIFKQLMEGKDPEVLKQGFNDDNFRLRSMAVGYATLADMALIKSALKDSSYQVVKDALAAACKLDPLNAKAYLEATKDCYGVGAEVKVAWLETRFLIIKEAEDFNTLVAMTSNSYEFRTRVNAAKALQRINHCTPELVNNLLTATMKPNRRLADPIKAVLRHFRNQHDFTEMVDFGVNQLKATPSKKQALIKSLKK